MWHLPTINEKLAEEIARDLEERYGIKARAYRLNILKLEEFKPLFEAIDQDFDRVDYFVSNAMIYGRSVVGGYGKFMKLRPMKGLLNIFCNSWGFCKWSQEAVKRMKKVGGGALYSSLQETWYIDYYAGALEPIRVLLKGNRLILL